MRLSRSGLSAIVLGLVVLAVIVCFAVFLPKAHGNAEGDDDLALATGSSGSLQAFPAKLSNGFLPIDVASTVIPADAASSRAKAEQSSVAMMTKLFGADASTRTYADTQGQQIVAFVQVAQPAGPFLPQGPPVDPASLGLARGQTEMVTLDGATCLYAYSQQVPAGQAVPQDEPAQVECQLNGGSTTDQAVSIGVTPQETVTLLHEIAGH